MSEDQIKENLMKEKGNLEKQITNYGKEDPYLGDDKDSRHNLEDAPTESEGHDRILATIREMNTRLSEVNGALESIEEGTYGICNKCKKAIGEDRLLALPTAKYCLDCESKTEA